MSFVGPGDEIANATKLFLLFIIVLYAVQGHMCDHSLDRSASAFSGRLAISCDEERVGHKLKTIRSEDRMRLERCLHPCMRGGGKRDASKLPTFGMLKSRQSFELDKSKSNFEILRQFEF